jgi:hypothetical protein
VAEQRLFTVAEANQLVPKLKKLLRRLTNHRQQLVSMNPEIQRARDNSENNGGSIQGTRYLTQLVLFSECAQIIEGLGVVIKDLDIGLCDFPHWKDGRVVYLCWKLGEDEVSWWHDVESGFAGRRPL